MVEETSPKVNVYCLLHQLCILVCRMSKGIIWSVFESEHHNMADSFLFQLTKDQQMQLARMPVVVDEVIMCIELIFAIPYDIQYYC